MSSMTAERLPGPDIVVGVDGSRPSTHGLIWALRLASARDWTVEAVTAWPDADAVLVHEVPGHFCHPRQHACAVQEAALAEAARTLGEPPRLEATIVNDHPVPALRERAARARLVVVGSRA